MPELSQHGVDTAFAGKWGKERLLDFINVFLPLTFLPVYIPPLALETKRETKDYPQFWGSNDLIPRNRENTQTWVSVSLYESRRDE